MPRNYRYGGNYRDNLLARLMFQQVYPEGTHRTEKVDGEDVKVPIDPIYQQKGDIRGAQKEASWGETDALAYALGSKRAKREGERPGAYSLAYYPQINFALGQAEAGNAPTGRGGGEAWIKEQQDPRLREQNEQKRKQWAVMQNRLLGMQPQYENKTYEEMRTWNRGRRNR